MILFLGPKDSPLLAWLREQGEVIIQESDQITPEYITRQNITFIISYNYRHILKGDVLEKLPDRAINLHIAYLPWNRGADPNFWSFVENTPKGVTIHYLDQGIDTGDIIAQMEVELSDVDTLATSYKKLHSALQDLFKEQWQGIKVGICSRRKQVGKGSFHLSSAKEALSHILTKGWDTETIRITQAAPSPSSLSHTRRAPNE